jgi:phospholipid-binding lipoprotein MlaA
MRSEVRAGVRNAAPLLLFPLLAAPAAADGHEAPAPRSVQAEVDAPTTPGEGTPGDPWEPMNRRVFAFNEGVDRWFLEPVATGWDTAVPDVAQRSIGNFFDNLAMPVRMVNEALQAKPMQAYETLWRFAMNTVYGVGGLIDVASHFDVYESDEDFGQTLGYWGVPPGPYWVLPLLGPSSPRDATGLALGSTVSIVTFFVPIPLYVTAPAAAVDTVNDRAASLETIRAEREAAFDFYTAVRSAFTQYRENRVRDRADEPDADAERDDDLYYLDEEATDE